MNVKTAREELNLKHKKTSISSKITPFLLRDKGMEFEFELWSSWVIDVWDCHGVLKLIRDAGRGSLPKLPKGMEWLNIGYFTIPITSEKKHLYTDKLKRKIHGFLESILEKRGGAINMSGIYPISVFEFNQLLTILAKYSPPAQETVSLANLF